MDGAIGAWIGAIGGVIGGIGAVGAWIVAIRANGRAAEANRTSREALDLQSRIDQREREYRNVEWTATHDRSGGFTLTNSGLTDATQVTLVMRNFAGSERHDLGDIPAQSSVSVQSAAAAAWMREAESSMPLSPPYFVHWSSPLGVADQREMPKQALFMAPDDTD